MRTQRKWTERECDRLRKLCEDGCSYLEAGEAMDRTRNSVGGKAQALGLKFNGTGFWKGSRHTDRTKAKIGAAVREAWHSGWRDK